MHLSREEIALFYKIWYDLVWGINQKHKVIPPFKKPRYGTPATVDMHQFIEVRDTMWANPAWIDEFLAEAKAGALTEQERDIIAAWRKHFIKGEFIVAKHLSKYTVLMTFDSQPVYLYGVTGISDSLKETMPFPTPFPANMVLLPWGDKIIYDSFIASSHISFGKGLRDSFREWYGESKEKYGIIQTLCGGNPVVNFPKTPQSKGKAEPAITEKSAPVKAKVPNAMVEKYNEIAALITGFSEEKLNEEYRELALKALTKLCRKRPSPLLKGKVATWACGIVYAMGANNFIFDKSQKIHMTATDIAAWFGISKSTAGNKASEVADLLHISPMDGEYMLSALIDTNPAIWFLEVNGYMMDIRRAPYEIQKEAYLRGMIPYIPADRE